MNDEPTSADRLPVLHNPFFDNPPSANGGAPEVAPLPVSASTHVNARSASLGLPELATSSDKVPALVPSPEAPVAAATTGSFPMDVIRRLRCNRPALVGAAALLGLATLSGGAAMALQPVGTETAAADEANRGDLARDGSPTSPSGRPSDAPSSQPQPTSDAAPPADAGGDPTEPDSAKTQRPKKGPAAGTQPTVPSTGGGSTSPSAQPTPPAGPAPTPPATTDPTPEPEPEPSVDPLPEPPQPTEPAPE